MAKKEQAATIDHPGVRRLRARAENLKNQIAREEQSAEDNPPFKELYRLRALRTDHAVGVYEGDVVKGFGLEVDEIRCASERSYLDRNGKKVVEKILPLFEAVDPETPLYRKAFDTSGPKKGMSVEDGAPAATG